MELAPRISRRETADRYLQDEIESYVINLRMLKKTLEDVRATMLARRSDLEITRQHLEGLREFVCAYQRTV